MLMQSRDSVGETSVVTADDTHAVSHPAAQAVMPQTNSSFKIGDKAVYPAHGVGEVTAIENREISGSSQAFYILRILDNGMKIMIPTTNVRQVGLREVIAADKVETVFDILRQKDLSVDTTTWNRRYREYMEKIKTGSVYEVAEVLRDLYLLKTDKDPFVLRTQAARPGSWLACERARRREKLRRRRS